MGEPTEIAPNGLPDSGYIELEQRKSPYAIAITDSYSTFALGPGYGIEELASLGRMRQRGSRLIVGMDPSEPSLKLGVLTELGFTLHIAPKVVIRQQLEDHSVNRDAGAVSEKEALMLYQQQIAEWNAEVKKTQDANKTTPRTIHP